MPVMDAHDLRAGSTALFAYVKAHRPLWLTLLTGGAAGTIRDEFLRQVDLRVVQLWQQGDFAAFTRMLPMYADKCWGEGHMHDTAMLYGALGWDSYTGRAEVLTPWFPSSGTGQCNAVFPVG